MKTQELLDKLNGAIAEAFVPHIGKPARLGDCHKIIEEAIEKLNAAGELTDSLRYTTWYIIANSGPSYYTHDARVFVVSSKGFEPYKGAAGERHWGNNGKWVTAPRYSRVTGIESDTVEGCVSEALLGVYTKKLEDQEQHIRETEEGLVNSRKYAQELRDLIAKESTKLNDAE